MPFSFTVIPMDIRSSRSFFLLVEFPLPVLTGVDTTSIEITHTP